MAGPALNPYLADVLAALQPFDAGAQAAGIAPPVAQPPVAAPTAPALSTVLDAAGLPSADKFDLAKLGAPSPPPAAPTMLDGGDSASVPGPAINAPGISPAIREPTSFARDIPGNTNAVQAGAPANDLPIGPDPHAFDLVAQGGGAVPAHELDLRGPSLTNAQNQRQGEYAGAINTVRDRNEQAANDEGQMYLSQERTARLREQAYSQSIAEQDEELQARQDDFDQTSRQLGRLGQLDQGRFWASRSTGQKIAGAIEVMLAGFRGAPSMVMKRIDDDVKAQEFAYGAARDAVQAKQTAFSAAMAKYQNVNAARTMARVASLDVVQAQLGQIAAMNKGNETGNRAIEAMAQLSNDRMLMIQNGIKFVPAMAGGRYWKDQYGMIYNEKEAHEYAAKQREYAQQERLEGGKVGGQLLLQHDKAALEAGPDGSPLTKEQRGKMEMERIERQKAATAFNEQIDYAKSMPELKQLGPGLAAREKLGPVLDPKGAVAAQTIHTLNSQVLNALGKIAKDNEGKPGIAMLDEYRKTFNIPVGSTQEYAQKKLEDARSTVNAFYRQQGIDVARPNGQVATPDEIKALTKTTSFTPHGGK